MELTQLKYFCDTAETENFSYTAKKYFVPPSSVSQSIKRLEQELGVDLFDHMGNKIQLAETGRQFYDKIKCALTLIDEGKKLIAESGGGIRGELCILILNNRRLVSEALEQFRKAYPNVKFVLKHLHEGNLIYDIVISANPVIGYHEEDLFVEEDIVLAVNRDHPLAQEEEIDAKDLYDEKFITMPKGTSLYDITIEICTRAGFLPNIAIQSPDPYYVRKYVESGYGIAFVPSCSWEGLYSEKIVLKTIGTYKRKTHIYLPNNRKIKPAVAAFLPFLDTAGVK